MADNKTSHEEKISLLRQMKSLLEQRTAQHEEQRDRANKAEEENGALRGEINSLREELAGVRSREHNGQQAIYAVATGYLSAANDRAAAAEARAEKAEQDAHVLKVALQATIGRAWGGSGPRQQQQQQQ
ncbi:hypothetical protein CKM354_000526900 [Cercospora kikuchii]|uniref:Uncharacterized protein n=1 Tax=Cercospora kikuchii TaxID=84275 RepID=A0A9P3FCA4_9PEZI|nr:uncharacterized protein CKM354_000526900 [Cercospora kikuchii]GIZ41988.1 hypothetical protein CKM354_000526900 [Cercospora kikuchii]